MDYLFQIIFVSYNCYRLFHSDACMGTNFVMKYLFQIPMNIRQTVLYCDVIYWNLVYVVCLVYMCVGGRGGVNLDISVSGVFGQYGAGVDIFLKDTGKLGAQ